MYWQRLCLMALVATTLSACASQAKKRADCEDQVGFLAALANSCESDAAIACKKAGGTLISMTMTTQACEYPASDSGKPCTDSDNCEGICIPPESAYEYHEPDPILGPSAKPLRRLVVKEGAALTGVCSSTRTDPKFINCEEYIDDGKLTYALCID